MAGRMQGQTHAVVHHGLSVVQSLQGDVAQPSPQHPRRCGRGQIVIMPTPGMVGMGMGDHRPRHRPPGVDVEIARRTVQPLGPLDHQIVGHQYRCPDKNRAMRIKP